MLTQIAWITTCFVLAIALSNRPIALVVFALILRIGIPSPASTILNGEWSGARSFHPAGWLLIATILVLAMERPNPFSAYSVKHPWISWSLVSMSAYAISLTALSRGFEPVLRAANVVVVPLLFFFLISSILRQDPSKTRVISGSIIAMGLFEALLGTIQSSTGNSILFGRYNSIQYWWPSDGVVTRGLGTLDSPLDLAAFLVACAALLMKVRNPIARLVLLCILVSGGLSTQSRLAIVVVIVVGVVLLLWSVKSVIQFALSIAVSTGLVYGFLASPLASGVLSRFTTDDGGSAAARSLASDYLFDQLGTYWLVGGGSGFSFTLRGTVLRTSLENGYGIFVFDFGIPFVVVLLFTQISLILVSRRITEGWSLGAVCLVVMIFAYSSMATQSAVGCLVWTFLAVAASNDHTAVKSEAPDDKNRQSDQQLGLKA